MKMSAFTDVPSLIRGARRNMSQRAFARAIGATQSMVSRYERGMSSPPASVLNACMQLMHQKDVPAEGVSAEQLASMVMTNLGKPGHAPLRLVIAQLIDGVMMASGAERINNKGKKQ